MSFRMKCPKCNTRDYSITRDIRTSTAKDPVAGLIYSCRCGKQMFGQMVVDEHERQMRAADASPTPRRDGAEPNREKLRQAYEYRREYVAKKRAADAEAAQQKKEEEDRKWRERVARTDGDPGSATAPSGDFEKCAWNSCEKARRPRSKYCSRECSNKNARHRHKSRKRSPSDAAA